MYLLLVWILWNISRVVLISDYLTNRNKHDQMFFQNESGLEVLHTLTYTYKQQEYEKKVCRQRFKLVNRVIDG